MPVSIEKLRCGECGERKMELTNVKGQSFCYKSYSSVKLIVDCYIPQCKKCGNHCFRGWSQDCKRVDSAIEQSLELGTDTTNF